MPVFVNSFLSKQKFVVDGECISVADVKTFFSSRTGVPYNVVRISDQSKIVPDSSLITNGTTVFAHLDLPGGKGGFGSMLRAIGAQIEKTTNREACRDLSGRRLRDINEEKRLKQWLTKQKEREAEAAQKKQEKLEKIRQEPKHQFKDKEYDKQRSELSDRISDAVEQGLKKSLKEEPLKRKVPDVETTAKKPRLWLGMDDLESELSSDDESNEENKDNSKKEDVKGKQNLDMNQYENAQDLEEKLGEEGLTKALKEVGLKTGGTTEEKAARLWAVLTGKKEKINVRKLTKTDSA